MVMAGWKSWEEARALAKDRREWKRIVRPYAQQNAKIGEVRDVHSLGYFHTKRSESSTDIRLTPLVQI